MVYSSDYPEERFVVKDAEYFDELRRAVAWTSPIALFGTSGLAVYQRIESAQDFELREQLSAEVYSKYHFQRMTLRILTAAIPWLSIPLTSVFIPSLPTKNASVLGLYALVAFALAVEFVWFVFAKFIQVFIWRAGSESIRHRALISLNPRPDDAASEPDA